MAQPTTNFDLGGVCEKIHKNAQDLAGRNYAFNLGRQLGALDFILSPENGGLKADYAQQSDKRVRAKVLYKQRTKPCEILDGAEAKDTGICDEAVEGEIKEVDVIVDDAVATKPRKFTHSKMIQICQDTQSFINEFLTSDKRALRERLDEKVLAYIAAAIGVKKRQNGTTAPAGQYTSVNLLGTNNGQPIPLFGNYSQGVLGDYQNMQFTGVPALIGQGNLQTFFDLQNIACCNSNTPYDVSVGRANAAFFLDQAANSVLGANRFVMAAFGASHLLWFNKNVGLNFQTPTNAHIVVQDEVYPQLKWDLDFKWDECNEVWVYQLSATFDVFNVFQADSFSTSSGESSPTCYDELWGVTGLWGYTAAQQA